MENAYAELVSLAVERRSRLEESRQLWQFYWDMAEEQNWIKEMGHIVSQAEIGHDLTTIHLLLSKHKSLETEIRYSFLIYLFPEIRYLKQTFVTFPIFLKLYYLNAMICTKILIALNVPFEVFIAWIILVTGLFWFIFKFVSICLSKHPSMYHKKN